MNRVVWDELERQWRVGGIIEAFLTQQKEFGIFFQCNGKSSENFKLRDNLIWSILAQMVKNLPAMQIWSLCQEDPLEECMQPTPEFLHGKSHGQRSLMGYSP